MNPLRKLRKTIIDTLGFSKTEANGLITLWILVILLALSPRMPEKSILTKREASGTTDWRNQIAHAWKQTFKPPAQNFQIKPMSGSFDPNTTSLADMVDAGVPPLIAKRITLYREKGGRFRSPEDISKIYGMNDELIHRLQPHVIIEQSTKLPTERVERQFAPEKLYTFELNSVTAEELQLVRGIGPYLSMNIVKYRERLGGFHSYDQLKEIKGLTPEIIADIQNRSSLVVNITLLDINADSLKVLLRHPYIDYNMARIIINYRKVHGNFERPEDLRGIKVMSDSLYQKLTPYLSK